MSSRTWILAIACPLTLAGCKAKPQAMAMDMTRASTLDSSPVPNRAAVRLTPAQAAAIGVTYTVVAEGPLTRSVRTVGQIVAPESSFADVTAKVDGYVEHLYVGATGVTVRQGEPLLSLYSPMLVSAEQELLTAAHLARGVDPRDAVAQDNAQSLLTAARRRLAYWDISPDQVAHIESTGEVTKALTLTAPMSGVVITKGVVEGQTVTAGMALYRLANLASVWLEGDAFEQDLALVHDGAPVSVTLTAYPGRVFAGRVSFVSPTVDSLSRTAVVRVTLPNRLRLLKPGMYGTLELSAALGSVVHVPAEAVVMTGERNLIYVVGADGALDPKVVVLGVRAGDQIQVLSGVRPGDRIVSSANFLVDAESRLSAGGSSMVGMPGMGEPATPGAHP